MRQSKFDNQEENQKLPFSCIGISSVGLYLGYEYFKFS